MPENRPFKFPEKFEFGSTRETESNFLIKHMTRHTSFSSVVSFLKIGEASEVIVKEHKNEDGRIRESATELDSKKQ